MKRRRSLYRLACAVLSFVATACGGESTDALIGEYAARDGGPAEFRVAKNGDDYTMAMLGDDGQWTRPDRLRNDMSADEMRAILGADYEKVEAFLASSEGVFLAKVPKGEEFQRQTNESGYYLFLLLYGSQVFKL